MFALFKAYAMLYMCNSAYTYTVNIHTMSQQQQQQQILQIILFYFVFSHFFVWFMRIHAMCFHISCTLISISISEKHCENIYRALAWYSNSFYFGCEFGLKCDDGGSDGGNNDVSVLYLEKNAKKFDGGTISSELLYGFFLFRLFFCFLQSIICYSRRMFIFICLVAKLMVKRRERKKNYTPKLETDSCSWPFKR